MGEAKSGLSAQLEAFAVNTSEFMSRERRAAARRRRRSRGAHQVRRAGTSLVVVRGFDHAADLKALKHYIREYKPVLVGVDGGADALLEAGLQAARDRRRHGRGVRRRAARPAPRWSCTPTRDGRAPGLARVQDLGIDAVTFPTSGTSEDVAMLLADEKGAALIVAVGTHATLAEFLDKGRAGMASTFLTRLRVGGKLVDAKGVTRLYRNRISAAALLLLVVAALIAIVRGAGRVRGRPQLPRPLRPQLASLRQLGTGPVLVISFRYHLVSIIAVFLALALGIVVGTTALNGPITTDLRKQVEHAQERPRPRSRSRSRRCRARSSDAGQFASSFGAQIVNGTLTKQNVLMIGLPGRSAA